MARPGLSIQDLPNELLSCIFRECVNLHSCSNTSTSYRPHVILCSINHRLRMLAITTPELWTYIGLGLHFNYPSIPFIELCVQRFGTAAPIHVDCHGPMNLDLDHPGEAIDEQHVIDTINLLSPHLHRWKSFRSFFEDASADLFSKLPLENARILEKIDIATPCEPDLDYRALANIAKLPALRHLTWGEYHINNVHSGIPIGPDSQSAITNFSWCHLRWLDVVVMLSVDLALQFLSGLTSAEVIHLGLRQTPLSRTESVSQPPVRLIRLPNLRELFIRSDVGVSDVLQHLDLPGLKNVRVRPSHYPWDGSSIPPFAGYKDFIIRISLSVPLSLESGVFSFWGFSRSDIAGLFSHHPEILRIPKAEFYVKDDRFDSEVVPQMIEKALNSMMGNRNPMDVPERYPKIRKLLFEYLISWSE